MHTRARVLVAALALFAACSGKSGPPGAAGATGPSGPAGPPGGPGTPAADRGAIGGVVKGSDGSAIAGATLATVPATVTAQTDAAGNATLDAIAVGAYTVVASKSGFVDAKLLNVGVAVGATTRVSLVLSPVGPTSGSIAGTIFGRTPSPTRASSPVGGAQVCVQGSTLCATSASDGTYRIDGVSPGPAYVSATATGFLPGERRSAAFVVAGKTAGGTDVTLSGKPTAAATYVGDSGCPGCHTSADAGLVAAWKGSAHYTSDDHSLAHVDVTGWPAEPADCAAPATLDTMVTATDPVANGVREVFVVRWKSGCAGKPTFAQAFDSNQNGVVDAADTTMTVTGTMGGVASAGGQCSTGGAVPADKPCKSTLAGAAPSSAVGWWQQEYSFDIGGAAKPAWVGWDTSRTPTDLLIAPAAWNQRAQAWANASDYNPTQGGTYAKVCAGCHNAGITLATDASGNVTTFSAATSTIACEKCHGPGSDHVAGGGDPRFIVNPTYITAQSQRELCGQCHSNGVASTSPAGAFDFAWNAAATSGGGNFIPGVHSLADFLTIPAYGDSSVYWRAGFPSTDHITYVDVQSSMHANNPYEKVTCADCHNVHGGVGGPYQFARTDGSNGDQYTFQKNSLALADDVMCLSCHASHGPFANLSLADTARYHLSMGGAVNKNGAAWSVPAADQAQAAVNVGAVVDLHMSNKTPMPFAYFDPLAKRGNPLGRCSSCHMAKTSATATFFSGPDGSGLTANVIGDVTSHTFRVALPGMSLATVGGATDWTGVMPNACGSCHPAYRYGK